MIYNLIKKTFFCFLGVAMTVSGCSAGSAQLPFTKVMNIGNALDAPRGNPWDVTLKNEYFTIIKKAGFEGVRLPVRFSDYVQEGPDYLLDEAFMQKVDGHVRYALNEGLYVILDLHHFVELMQEPEEYHARFLAIWHQLSDRYKDYPDKLIFEVLNEPQKNLYGERWNTYLAQAVAIIRQSNPDRYIVVGPDFYNSFLGLSRLVLPETHKLILTFHYYSPPEFTFQAHEHLGFEYAKNVKWLGTQEEVEQIRNDFAVVSDFAQANNIPVLLGEFGVNEKVNKKMRNRWTAAVRKEAEAFGFSWAYWEFASHFGAYDANRNKWRSYLLEALMKN